VLLATALNPGTATPGYLVSVFTKLSSAKFNNLAILSQAFGWVTFANNLNLFKFLIYNLA
jgi:hypothetical protein